MNLVSFLEWLLLSFHGSVAIRSKKKEKVLENLLPSMYKYNISSFKIVEESDIEIETKFEAVIGVNVCSEEGINKFLVEFEKSSAIS